MMVRKSIRFNDSDQTMADPTDTGSKSKSGGISPDRRTLSPEAQRALAEAAERRKEYDRREAAQPKEVGGRGGKDPGRYGDWEVKGLASDF
jgi:hypothetical protein